MEYKVYPENKTLCLTPEDKIDSWFKKIHDMAAQGNIIKLYADTETTGLVYWAKGRAGYDPIMDKKLLGKDAATYNIPFAKLEKEARELEGKVDRMIEIAFVASYTNKNGETYPLLDDEGNQIYFHEMVSPYKDIKVEESKQIKEMPLVPYEVHKTSFDFLRGNEEHPFLNITLPHEAPGTTEVLSYIKKLFDYEDDSLYDNIIMLFHNADGFDVPFINSEMYKTDLFNGQSLRDMTQVVDTLTLVKLILPTPVKKFLMNAQSEEIFGGDSRLKKDPESLIKGTSNSLDNIIKVARFLPDLDIHKAFEYQNGKQDEFANKFKTIALKEKEKLWSSILDYFENPSINIDLSEEAPKDLIKSNKAAFDEYKDFRTALNNFDKSLSEVKALQNGDIYNNLLNIKENIDKNNDLAQNIKAIKSISRDAHGAFVDSLLFMYSFTIVENTLYKNQKNINELKSTADLKLPDIALEIIKKKSEPKVVDSDSTKDAIMKFTEKYDPQKKERKAQLKI